MLYCLRPQAGLWHKNRTLFPHSQAGAWEREEDSGSNRIYYGHKRSYKIHTSFSESAITS